MAASDYDAKVPIPAEPAAPAPAPVAIPIAQPAAGAASQYSATGAPPTGAVAPPEPKKDEKKERNGIWRFVTANLIGLLLNFVTIGLVCGALGGNWQSSTDSSGNLTILTLWGQTYCPVGQPCQPQQAFSSMSTWGFTAYSLTKVAATSYNGVAWLFIALFSLCLTVVIGMLCAIAMFAICQSKRGRVGGNLWAMICIIISFAAYAGNQSSMMATTDTPPPQWSYGAGFNCSIAAFVFSFLTVVVMCFI